MLPVTKHAAMHMRGQMCARIAIRLLHASTAVLTGMYCTCGISKKKHMSMQNDDLRSRKSEQKATAPDSQQFARRSSTGSLGLYLTSVASFLLPTAMMHSPTVNVEMASQVSDVPMATSGPAPAHMAAMDVAMAL